MPSQQFVFILGFRIRRRGGRLLRAVRALAPLAASGLLATEPGGAIAGVFDTPHFVTPGDFAIGLEPELTLANDAGVAANLKYKHGLNDLMNAQAIVGTGNGPRRFRVGANMVFDFFPDIEGQPGIGLATQGVYYRLKDSGEFELIGVPYIHKNFSATGKNEVEPFVAIPFGMIFASGRYRATSTATIGAMFKSSDHLRYVMEVGVAINNADAYVSGGLIYYH